MQPTSSHQRRLQSMYSHGYEWRVSMCGRVLTSREILLGRTLKSLGRLFQFSRSGRREMFRNLKSECQLVYRDGAASVKLSDEHWGEVLTRRQTHTLNRLNPSIFLLFVILFIFYRTLFLTPFYSLASFWLSRFSSPSKKKRGKHEKWPSWSSWKVINGQREFCLLSPLLILCGIKTPLCQSPSALVGVKALQYIKAPLWSVLPVWGGRAYSSTQSLALSKSCMVKSMQSLTEYTKDYRIWVRRKTHSAHILAHF